MPPPSYKCFLTISPRSGPLEKYRLLLMGFALMLPLLLSGCAAPQKPGAISRADPGYTQWLLKQSMLAQSQRFVDIVSGSHLQWRKSALHPDATGILGEADTWLTVRPESILSKSNEPVFQVLGDPQLWQSLQQMGIRGLLPVPAQVTGDLWEYSLTSTRSKNIIQYTFADNYGNTNDFMQLMERANAHGAVLGGMLLPAATGMGPDFFLAARGKKDYAGLYCMIEVPRKLWKLLPHPPSEWQGVLLKLETLKQLRAQNILPPPLAAMRNGVPLYWAATGEISGIDGNTRRWLYLSHENASRPVLNWTDPSANARRILSGSIIQQTGELGMALLSFSMEPFAGAVIDENDSRAPASPLSDATKTVCAEIRRYGGWSLLTDGLQLPLLADLLASGPDMAIDRYTSPLAAHALLTGDAEGLRLSLQMLHAAGIDHRRLVHPVLWENGIDYSLPHLDHPPFGPAPMLPWRGKKLKGSAIQRSIMDELRRKVPENILHVSVARNAFCVTSSGVAAYALGLFDQRSGLASRQREIIHGTLLLTAWNALLPGGFMLDGRDLAGSMPLPVDSLPQDVIQKHPELLAHGAYALDATNRNLALSRQSLPKTQMLHDSLPVQLMDDTSYAANVARILAVRKKLGVPFAELAALPPANAPGVATTMLRLPPDQVSVGQHYLLIAANFGSSTIRQHITTRLSDVMLKKAEDILTSPESPSPTPLVNEANTLSFNLYPWQVRAILLPSSLGGQPPL